MMKKLLLLILSFFISLTNAQDWEEQIMLQPNQGTSHHFGKSVSIDGDFAVIGAPNENNQTGAANVYKKDANGNWNHIQKITAYVGQSSDEYFGSTVHIKGDFIFIAAPTDRLNEAQFQNPAGSVMIYKNNGNDNFVGVQRIRSSDISTGDYFGDSIDSFGDYLVVGAPNEDHDLNGNNALSSAGSAYIFKKDNNDVWNEVQKIIPSHRTSFDNVGYSVAIHEDFLVLGSQNNSDVDGLNPVNGNGSAFVFKKDNNDVWSEFQKLKSSVSQSNSLFGYNGVDVFGDYIAIGARKSKNSQNNTVGAIHLFKIDGAGASFLELQKLEIAEYRGEIELGTNIAIDNNYIIASAPLDYITKNGQNISGAGSAYVFKNNGGNWIETLRIETSDAELNASLGGGLLGTNLAANSSVSFDGTHFIIGSQLKDANVGGNNFIDAGSAYISGNINTIVSALSVKEVFEETKTKVFYNYSINKLVINLLEHTTNFNFEVFNILGKKIIDKKEIDFNKISIDFNFPNGIYLVKITFNNKTQVVKILKN